VGLQTGYLINEPLAETHVIGVRFKLGGASPFFALPASELHNHVVPMEVLWGRFAAEIRPFCAAGTIIARALAGNAARHGYRLVRGGAAYPSAWRTADPPPQRSAWHQSEASDHAVQAHHRRIP
jgi:hypothetical protein